MGGIGSDGYRALAPARAVVWGQLATGFQRPSPATHARLFGSDGRRVLVEATRQLDAAGAAGDLAAAAERFASRAILALDDLQLRYDRLFGHTARGLVCAYETEYGAGAGGLFRQPQELADISGYYEAFGLRPRAEGERVDHIACECEFMGFLAQREICALSGNSERAAGDGQVETTLAAARSFLRAHLGRFGIAFGERLRREEPEGCFGDLARVLVETLQAEAAGLSVPLGPATLDLRPPEPDTTPMACGSACETVAAPLPAHLPERP